MLVRSLSPWLLLTDGPGHFTVDMIQATGPGGAAILTTVNPNITTGAALAGGIHDDVDKGSVDHGMIMAIVALAIAPVDMITASALRRFPVLHIITSTGYLAFMIAGIALGIKISGEYIAVSSPLRYPLPPSPQTPVCAPSYVRPEHANRCADEKPRLTAPGARPPRPWRDDRAAGPGYRAVRLAEKPPGEQARTPMRRAQSPSRRSTYGAEGCCG